MCATDLLLKRTCLIQSTSMVTYTKERVESGFRVGSVEFGKSFIFNFVSFHYFYGCL